MLPVAVVLLVFGIFAAAAAGGSPRNHDLRARVLAAQEEAARAGERARELADEWSRQ